MSKEIAALGSDEFLLGFRLAGVKRAVPAAEMDYGERLDALLRDRDVGIVLVNAAEFARLPAAARRRALDSIDPVVIQIGEAGEDDLREKVKRAIGIDLYKEA